MNKKDKRVSKKHRRNKERLKQLKKTSMSASSKQTEKVITKTAAKKPVAKKGQLASYAEKAWAYVPPVRKSARLQAQKNKTQLEKVKEARTKRAALKKKYTKNEINMLTAQRKNKETRERNVLRRKLQDIDNAARPNSTKLRREVGNLRRRINLKTRVIDELNYNLKFNANKGFIQRLLR